MVMEDKIFGVMLLCIAFIGPTVTYRFTYKADPNEGSTILCVFAAMAGLFIGFMGLSMMAPN